jgi:hypothetical protein
MGVDVDTVGLSSLDSMEQDAVPDELNEVIKDEDLLEGGHGLCVNAQREGPLLVSLLVQVNKSDEMSSQLIQRFVLFPKHH